MKLRLAFPITRRKGLFLGTFQTNNNVLSVAFWEFIRDPGSNCWYCNISSDMSTKAPLSPPALCVFSSPHDTEVIPTIMLSQDIQAGSDGISCLGTLFTNSSDCTAPAQHGALLQWHKKANQEQSGNGLFITR